MPNGEVEARRPTRHGNYDLVPRDFTLVNIDNQPEIAYRCAKFRCTGSQLREAVAGNVSSASVVTIACKNNQDITIQTRRRGAAPAHLHLAAPPLRLTSAAEVLGTSVLSA